MNQEPKIDSQNLNPTNQNHVNPVKSGIYDQVKNAFGSLYKYFSGLTGKLKIPEKAPEIVGMMPTPGISPKTKKIVIAISMLFFVTLILFMVLMIYKGKEEKPISETQKELEAQTTIIERKPSRYATDEVVLKMETDLKTLEEEVNRGEIEEKSLIPPNLNFQINFKD